MAGGALVRQQAGSYSITTDLGASLWEPACPANGFLAGYALLRQRAGCYIVVTDGLVHFRLSLTNTFPVLGQTPRFNLARLCGLLHRGVRAVKSFLTPDTFQVTVEMIRSFKHKGLASFFESGSTAGIQAAHARKLRLILGRLNVALNPRDMDLPGLRLHRLAGNRAETWSVSINGNWRVTFRFEQGDAKVVDYEDYH